MRALLLAAGFGSRLRPLTLETPKCLVEIGGHPLLYYWLKSLKKAGIKKILINTHYLSDQVDEFILNNEFSKNIVIKHEDRLLGTAKTLIKNANFFEEPVIVIHADNYSEVNLAYLIDAHKNRPNCCLISMMTFRSNSPKECGVVELNSDSVVVGFHEKVENPPSNLANAAVYIFEPEAMKEIIDNNNLATDLSLDVINKFLGRIYCIEINDFFIDVGSIESLQIARKHVLGRKIE